MANDLELAIQQAILDNKISTAPTLKAIAIVLNVKPIQLYTISKTAIPNVIYDARIYNWDAIAKYIARRFDPDIGIKDFVDLIDKAIEEDINILSSDRRNKLRTNKINVNGRIVPARKFHVDLGYKVMLKDGKNNYTVVYLTDTHAVLQVGESQELTMLSNWTFNNRVEGIKKCV